MGRLIASISASGSEHLARAPPYARVHQALRQWEASIFRSDGAHSPVFARQRACSPSYPHCAYFACLGEALLAVALACARTIFNICGGRSMGVMKPPQKRICAALLDFGRLIARRGDLQPCGVGRCFRRPSGTRCASLEAMYAYICSLTP